MGIGTTSGVTGVLTAALFSVKGLWNPNSNTPQFYTHVEITPEGGTFSDWKLDEDGNEVNSCGFWNMTHYYAPRLCDAFGVSRISYTTGKKAIERAIKCGAQFDTQCILSGEIGFSAPAAFIYDAESGFRMILAPRFVTEEGDTEEDVGISKLVRIQDPSEKAPNSLIKFNSSVTVEYITPGSRAVVTEKLQGHDAFCIQALRLSVSPSCWKELD